MKKSRLIGIIDYGMGNLRSVSKAIERLGDRVYVGSDPKKLGHASKLILPGVGAFGDGMRELRKRGLISVIHKARAERKMILGICLGLQLFFERSEESPKVKGLGLWKGSVVRFPRNKRKNLRIPHMGWNEVEQVKPNPLLSGVKNKSYFYFVHSYYAKPKGNRFVVGKTRYGISFPAILVSDRLYAVQFHPEKSQTQGLQILKNFIRL